MSRTIGQAAKLLVASPDYIATQSTPTHPRDLEAWKWIHFSMRPERAEMISKSGKSTHINCTYQIEVDSAQALYEFAIRSLGVTAIPENLANRGISRGELVHVLPEWSLPSLGLYAMWPDRSRRESLALIFVRFLADHSDRL
jgi:DNA-binding transcriptional LysR family regulator